MQDTPHLTGQRLVLELLVRLKDLKQMQSKSYVTLIAFTLTLVSACGSSSGGDAGATVFDPSVSYTDPADGATSVATNSNITATFTTPMNATSLTANTFTVMPSNGGAIAGSVVYNTSLNLASFIPSVALNTNTTYTATLVGVADANAKALSKSAWQFTTGGTAAAGPAAVLLGASGNYAILAKTAISNVTGSSVTGDVALSPAAASYITGFSLVADATNTFSKSSSVVGKLYAANYAPPTPTVLTTAVGAMQAAYTDAAGRVTPDHSELGSGNIGGMTLTPGLYKWTTSVSIPTNVTLSGGANDVWIFQVTGDLTVAAAQEVIMAGAQAKNVFWQVAGSVEVGTTAHLEGVVLCQTAITLQTGASFNGRLLAQTAVAMDNNDVTAP